MTAPECVLCVALDKLTSETSLIGQAPSAQTKAPKVIHENIVIGRGIKAKKSTEALGILANLLTDNEKILALFEAGTKFGTSVMAVTSWRVIELDRNNKVMRQANISEFSREDLVKSNTALAVTLNLAHGDSVKYRFFAFSGSDVEQSSFIHIIESQLGISSNSRPEYPSESLDKLGGGSLQQSDPFSGAKAFGPKLSKKSSEALRRQQHNSKDTPWLIINTSGFGLMAAFDDRAVVIKTGFWTSIGAGAMGGERIASFNFHDITGLEYNAGMMNGVLEILTASYSGAKNQDFWKGTLSSTNSNSSNPATLSNTLPLSKMEYRAAEKQIGELRKRINDSKKPQVVAVPAESASLASQILELKALLDSGIIDDQEFAAAKAKLIS